MKKIMISCALLIILLSLLFLFPSEEPSEAPGRIVLPEPRYESDVSVEEALLKRRSIRSYSDEALSWNEISQILWAVQGITDPRGFRTAPSAGALYPLEVYLVMEEGVFHYNPEEHSLQKLQDGDFRRSLSDAALGQPWVANAPVDLVITGVFERTTKKYGQRGERYVYMEAGHAAQNVYLQCVSLGLGTVVVGAFYDEEVKRLLNLTEDPLYIMPIGKVK
jgi:SagB-type dehydrogenase family enzyme